jgi:hypothetical protein
MSAAVRQSRIALKAKPMIIAGIAEDDAARGLKPSELLEPCSDKQLTKTPPLPVRSDGDWPKAVPVPSGAGDHDGRERHMSYDLVLIYADERHGQRPSCPEAFDDARLGPAAVKRGLERRSRDMADCGDVSWSLGSDFQCRQPE